MPNISKVKQEERVNNTDSFDSEILKSPFGQRSQLCYAIFPNKSLSLYR